jgi:ER membrane protein SH3
LTAFVTAGGGFLLAVLWFDLMFDVQVLRRAAPSRASVDSIAAYYRRVTLEASPMNRLVALAMLGTLVALALQVAREDDARWASAASLVLALAAIGLAVSRTFRRGARLGAQRDEPERQLELARLMLRDHLLCLAAIVAVLVLQLAFVR